MSATRFRWERNALMAAAHLTADDGGSSYVFCALPGGTPWFALRRDGPATTIVGAPTCDAFSDFKRFVTERFGD